MPNINTTPTPSSPNDLPPPYTLHDLNPYAHTHTHTRQQVRGAYLRAIMMHNLRLQVQMNGPEDPSSPASSSPSSSAPIPLPTPPDTEPPTPPHTPPGTALPTPAPNTNTAYPNARDRCYRAAMREYEDSQNPELYGRRVGHGRGATWLPEHDEEEGGFWSRLGDLLVIRDERGNPVSLGSTSPWGIIGPNGVL